MKDYIICLVMSFLVLALAAISGSEASAADEFLYYGDTDMDGKFDTRDHFEGDLISVINSVYPSALSESTECDLSVHAAFTITCLHVPPCPAEQPRCLPPQNLAVFSFGTDQQACACFVGGAGSSSAYLQSAAQAYRQLPVEESFLDFLLQNFTLVNQTTGGELCDGQIGVDYTLDCDGFSCDPVGGICDETGATVDWIITNLPACNCYAGAPTLTQYGLIALLVVLAGVATWVVIKRRRVVTA